MILYGKKVSGLSSTLVRKTFKTKEVDDGLYVVRNDIKYGNVWNEQAFDIYDILKDETGRDLYIQDVESQLEYVKTFNNVYNNDLVTSGNNKLGTHRIFKAYDVQLSSDYIVLRNEKAHREYVDTLNDGVTIIDDDISTGASLRFLSSHINKKVSSMQTLVFTKDKYFDVVDQRDFLIGSRDGGLVVLNNNKLSRVPYLFPYVNLYTRASMENTISASLKLWYANLDFFDGTDIKLDDCDEMFYNFIVDKFDTKMLVVDFCKYHIDMINNE